MFVRYQKTIAGVPAGTVREVTEAHGRTLLALGSMSKESDRIIEVGPPDAVAPHSEAPPTPSALPTPDAPPKPKRGRPRKLPEVTPGGFDKDAGE